MNQPKAKKKQVTRDNHYVPQWYQRGFMPKGRHKLFVRNLQPGVKSLPNGQTLDEPEVEELGPKLAFVELDLYTTRFGPILNDDIETFVFGPIDKTGADAVRGWISGNQAQIHRRFQDFFGYLDAQKLRTPKGLDWILKHYDGLPQLDLDLPPTSRTRLKLVKSVNHQENDGHEEEQIHRGTDHRLPQAGRGRHADQGAVPQWRFQ